MKWLQNIYKSIPGIPSGVAERLFKARGRGAQFSILEEWRYRTDFKRMIASIPGYERLNVTPNMIRPSVILKAALERDARTMFSQRLGQHGTRVHELGYVDRHPTRYLRDTDIRLFQYSMETLVIQNVEDAHEFLKLDQEGMTRRVDALMRTGLGTMCANRYGKPGQEGSLCKSLDCVSGCTQLVLFAIPEEIALLQIWQQTLRDVEGDWIRDRPDRWERVWLPWLCFCDAVEVKMRQSHSQAWRAATKLSTEMLAHPNFQRRRPH